MNARLAREQLGLTQEQAAEKIDCAVPVLQRLERAAAAVTVDFVARVASSYRVDIHELFKDVPWVKPRPGRPRTAPSTAKFKRAPLR